MRTEEKHTQTDFSYLATEQEACVAEVVKEPRDLKTCMEIMKTEVRTDLNIELFSGTVLTC